MKIAIYSLFFVSNYSVVYIFSDPLEIICNLDLLTLKHLLLPKKMRVFFFPRYLEIFISDFQMLLTIGTRARPQKVVLAPGALIQEVTDDKVKEQVFKAFRAVPEDQVPESSNGRSILYESLPDFQGKGPFVTNVQVESPVLVLFKPKDRDAKRREKAEARTQ